MTENNQQPRPDDAVLGGNSPDISSAAVLGGIEGAVLRFNSNNEDSRLLALKQATQYGEKGLDLIIKGLEDPSEAIRQVAFNHLKNRTETKVKEALAKHCLLSFTERLPNSINLEMIAIPSGSFLMGSTEEDIERLNKQYGVDYFNYQKPQHQVTLAAFHIGKYPVTQEQYQAVMGNNPSKFKGSKNPVEQVSWYDAQEYCQKLSKMTGRTYRLPSEAQWEYAARATTQTSYYFGDNENQLKEYAWYWDNSNKQTHPVGEKKPNKWGLYDMLGNVWEWCEDDWHDNYNGAPTDGRAWINNDNRSQSKSRIMRGGSWNNDSRYCRCAYRLNNYPAGRYFCSGFRVAVVAARTQ